MPSHPLAFYAPGATNVTATYKQGLGETSITVQPKTGYWTLIVPAIKGQATKVTATVTWADGSVEKFGPRNVGSAGQRWDVVQGRGVGKIDPTHIGLGGGAATTGTGTGTGTSTTTTSASGDVNMPDATTTTTGEVLTTEPAGDATLEPTLWERAKAQWKTVAGAGGVLAAAVAIVAAARGASRSGRRNSCGC